MTATSHHYHITVDINHQIVFNIIQSAITSTVHKVQELLTTVVTNNRQYLLFASEYDANGSLQSQVNYRILKKQENIPS